MTNLKVVLGCTVSAFFGLLWLYVWRKPPKRQPGIREDQSSHQADIEQNPSGRQSDNKLNKNHQSDNDSNSNHHLEMCIESLIIPTNKSVEYSQVLEERGKEEEGLLVKEGIATEATKRSFSSSSDKNEEVDSIIEEIVIRQEGESQPRILTVTDITPQKHSHLSTGHSQPVSAADTSTSEFNTTKIAGTNVSVGGKNSVLNEAFVTSCGDRVLLDKSCDKKVGRAPVSGLEDGDDTLSTSTMEPLLESTQIDATVSEPVRAADEVVKPESEAPLHIDIGSKLACDHVNTRSRKHKHSNQSNDKNQGNNGAAANGNRSAWSHDSREMSLDTEIDSSVSTNDHHINRDVCDHDVLNDKTNSDETMDKREAGSEHSEDDADHKEDTTSEGDNPACAESPLSNGDTASNDSGRGSLKQEDGKAASPKDKFYYQFNFPTHLCGKLIGKFGRNINQIKDKTGTMISIHTNPYTPDFQLCLVEGRRRNVEQAVHLISKRFPDVNTEEVTDVDINGQPKSPPALPNGKPMMIPDVMQLNLPESVTVDAIVSSIVDAGHIFIQQPTHPSFPSLERLNQFMISCYTQDGIVPQLPRPLEVGVICAAPMLNGWYRAQITQVYEETDDCDIKFVDYGGFSRVPGCTLRQIRSDFMTLPFQAVECYMANITPLQDEPYFSTEAGACLEELTQGKLLQAQVVGYAEDGTPYVHVYQINGETNNEEMVKFVNRELVKQGLTRWIEILS